MLEKSLQLLKYFVCCEKCELKVTGYSFILIQYGGTRVLSEKPPISPKSMQKLFYKDTLMQVFPLHGYIHMVVQIVPIVAAAAAAGCSASFAA